MTGPFCRLRRLLPLLTLVVAGTVLLSPATAYACSCALAADDARYLAHSDVAFTGRLVERQEPSLSFSSTDPVTLVFTVDRVYKGTAARTQGVETARSGASCGVDLPAGRPVIVFADSVSDHLSAELCSGSRVLDAGEKPFTDGEAPGAGTTGVPAEVVVRSPRPGAAGLRDDRLPLVAVAATGTGAVAVLGGGLLLLHRRRRDAGSRPG